MFRIKNILNISFMFFLRFLKMDILTDLPVSLKPFLQAAISIEMKMSFKHECSVLTKMKTMRGYEMH